MEPLAPRRTIRTIRRMPDYNDAGPVDSPMTGRSEGMVSLDAAGQASTAAEGPWWRLPRFTGFVATAAMLAMAGCAQFGTPGQDQSATAVEPLVVSPAAPRPDAAMASRAGSDLVSGLFEPAETAPVDVIARLRARFALPVVAHETVASDHRWFADQQAYLDRVFERGSPWLHFIANELEAHDMPADYALLPIIESAFDPLAYSHGRAAGLWQFIPGTGRRFELKQNWWYDGRRDVIESTRAAIEYLSYLHQYFDGDWLLATAAYNAGEGTVIRALRRAEAAGQPTDFFSLQRYLPRETRAYVPRLLALRDVVADPEAFGITLPVIPDQPVFAIVDTGGQIDIALAAELAGMPAEALYELNPAVNRWATDPDGPHRLLVPVATADSLTAALSELGENDRVRWTRHRIESGETLIGIAARYRISVDLLREINNLHGSLIRAGDHLMVPNAYGTHSADTATLLAQVGALGNAVNGENQTRQVTYTVRSGDSLYSIAQRFRVTLANLLEWNGVSTERHLQPGQRLIMYVNVADQSS